jgi:uncharacterized membrane protein HdeD (DUF308 family)
MRELNRCQRLSFCINFYTAIAGFLVLVDGVLSAIKPTSEKHSGKQIACGIGILILATVLFFFNERAYEYENAEANTEEESIQLKQ